MLLKKIELQGFKSFANKTQLEIDRGVTAIVGPNGSGKSNIIDAIKWVLGEQSVKSLRGSKMEDVIFSGSSDSRQKNYAQVTLTLDNKQKLLDIEYSEVNISRRYFRDGQSQYFINKTECRLKDIHELFMDTGLGKEAYSVIGQGQVDEILTSRPEERRIIFEEASGIVKYKSKKLQSIQKLEQTQQNLQRVEDIIIEVESEIPTIKEQAFKAEKYKSLKEKLKNTEVGIILHRLDELDISYKGTTGKIESLSQRLQEKESELDALFEQLQKDENYLKKLEQSSKSVIEAQLDNKGKMDNIKYKLEYLREKVEDLRSKIEEKKFQNEKIKSEITNFKIAKNKSIEEKKENEKLLQDYSIKIEDFKEKTSSLNVKLANKKQDLEHKKESLIKLLNDLATDKNDIKNIDSYINRLESDYTRKKNELKEYENKLKDSLSRYDLINQKKELTWKKYRELDEQYSNLYTKYNEIEKKKEKKQNIVTEAEKKLNVLQTQLQGIKQLENNYSGYNMGPKEILKKFSTNKDIYGAVAQIFNVEKAYSTAIETVLGGSLQNIVVANAKTAEECIKYLKNNHAGRATFLPLDIVKGKKINYDKQQPGVIGIASELVNCASELDGIKDYLLGRIFVVDNLNNGLLLAKSQGYRYRIVTLDGELINAGGSMSGGRYKGKSTGLLKRNAQIKETMDMLEKQQEFFVEKQKELKVQIEHLNEIEIKLEQVEEQKQTNKLEINELEQQIMLIEQKITSVRENVELLQEEINSLIADKNKYQSRVLQKEESIQAMERNEKQLNEEVKEYQTEIENIEESLGEAQSKQVSQKITIASLKEKLSALKRDLKGIDERILQNENNFDENLADLNKMEEQENKGKAEIENLVNESFKLQERNDALEKEKLIYSGKIQSIKLKIQTKKQQHQDITSTLEKDKESINNLNLKKSRVLMEIEQQTEKLLGEYYLTVNEALKDGYEPFNSRSGQKEVKRLREDIKGMGTVNLGALDEYQRLSHRLDFLQEQKSDLNKSRMDLQKIITEMDKQMAEQFELTFKTINKNFNEVFKKLFGGGQGYLKLSNPNQMLESGVEIFVQPPGKKMQSMSLLSGGEKALTAITLLFSILMTRPSPFCVLDEIEASLDEANVNRFASFLKELSQKSQFLVVTHRQGTMSYADMLYGITMEDSGVSKLISVKFDDEKVG
ncbi:chromosome segregation protein SMC [Proteinivorax tanatarense]|uniref:Chromosome partition protein Smc n=1 Tax=Proteinivorax tanatarense TaxID=1260629 RepID=A0AAU7VQF3_9FIRM